MNSHQKFFTLILCTLSIIFFEIIFLLPVTAAQKNQGEDWFVRSYDDGPYGESNGTTYNNAWRTFNDIKWGPEGVDAGDTLYICGFHTGWTGHYLQIGASGTPDKPITIDGKYPSCDENEEGFIFGSYQEIEDGWEGPDEFGVYIHRGGDVLNNSFGYEDTGKTGEAANFVRLIRRTTPPDETWEDGSAWIYITDENERIIYYKPTTGIPTDHKVYVESGGGINTKGYDYITIRNLSVWGSNTLITVCGSDGIHIEGNNLRWAAHKAVKIECGSDDGVIFDNDIYEVGNGIYASNIGIADSDDGSDNWYISYNRIHHLSDQLAYGTGLQDGQRQDHHAIGWQNGDNNLVEYNEVHHGGGSMIEFWTGKTGHERNNIIRYNFIHDNPSYDITDDHYVKSGISFGSHNEAQGDRWTNNKIYYNIVSNVGSRAIYTKTHNNTLGLLSSGLYHNVVYNTYLFSPSSSTRPAAGNAFEGGPMAVFKMKNNVALDNEGYQFFLNNSIVPVSRTYIKCNVNLYWQSTGENMFKWENTEATGLEDWQYKTEDLGYPQDGDSLEADPLYENESGSFSNETDFTPREDSPLIDAGEEIPGIPDQDFLGNPIYGIRDIGAIEYQPVLEMGNDVVDIYADVRVYGNGKFRNTMAPFGTPAALLIIPSSDNTREFLDVVIKGWGASKQWSETSSTITGAVVHMVGDLQAGGMYEVKYRKDGGTWLSLTLAQANTKGEIGFSYDHGYSKVEFEVRLANLPVLQRPWSENENGKLNTNLNINITTGYHFTPLVNGTITKLGEYFNGTKKISLWETNDGTLLAQTMVTSNNHWIYGSIEGVPVEAGNQYTVAVYIDGSGGSRRIRIQELPQDYRDIRIDGMTYVKKDQRPVNIIYTKMYGQADIEFLPNTQEDN